MIMSKVLLVEDNEMNRDMLSRRLERKGYEVVFAEDGSVAVEMAGSENPDLILMDMINQETGQRGYLLSVLIPNPLLF